MHFLFRNRWKWILPLLLIVITFQFNSIASDREFLVYGVNLSLPMGDVKNETPQKDYYINVGKSHGVQRGTVLQVFRKLPTTNEMYKYQYDLKVPVTRMVVIHAERNVAIGRIMELPPNSERPVLDVPAVIIGDNVEVVPDDAYAKFKSYDDPERSISSLTK